ncbi:hypothetical protein ACFSCX_17570 [Bacillus salitolerans]|uniref:Uncharacterized protein n=1 Tax=Bacillus salitolerans TaxID=1437434 RepID=A0ABW4LT78_9BACI
MRKLIFIVILASLILTTMDKGNFLGTEDYSISGEPTRSDEPIYPPIG